MCVFYRETASSGCALIKIAVNAAFLCKSLVTCDNSRILHGIDGLFDENRELKPFSVVYLVNQIYFGQAKIQQKD